MKTLYDRAAKAVRYLAALRIPLYASHASFFIVLSVFPTLVLLLGLLRYTGLEVSYLTGLLAGFVPKALLPAAEDLIVSTYYSSSGTLLSLSALTALWSAGRGIGGLMTGLNAIYGSRESRGYLRTRAVSAVYTVAFLFILLLTLLLQVFGNDLLHLTAGRQTPFFRFLTEVAQLRFFLLLALQTGLFCTMFAVLPDRKNRFRDSLPGALLASMGWLVFSDLYSLYVEHFSGYASVYGSVYAVALSMLWLYCCVSILFYGGALNAWLIKSNRCDFEKKGI